MAHMYPPVLIPGQDGAVPPGERKLFERLRDAPGTEDWHVLHSYFFPRHVRQRSGEADFVVIIPGKGIIVLEVKSHGPNAEISRDEKGVWKLGTITSPKGPFRQASDNAETLRSEISDDPLFSGLVVTSAVWFTHRDAIGVPSNGEWHPWQALDRSHFTRRPAATSLLHVIDSARRHLTEKGLAALGKTKEPSPSTAKALVQRLRPAFELTVNRTIQRRAVEEELLHFTTEQFAVLDVLSNQLRAEIRGAAGTGKTLLAVEMAHRRASAGDRVLLCCFNRALGEVLQAATADAPSIHAGTLHKELLGIAGVDWQGDADFASKRLPTLALEKLLQLESAPYDALIIDEAQDLLSEEYLDCLDLMLVGGLASGRVVFFGDYERQAIFAGSSVVSLRTRIPDLPAPFSLTINCRNTPETEAPLYAWSDLAANAYTAFRRPEGQQQPPRQFFGQPASQAVKLAEILDELRRPTNAYNPEDVVILSPTRNPVAVQDLPTSDPWHRYLSHRRMPKRLWSTTIHSFKGLESPVVILVGIDDITSDAGKSLLYIGMTRATERLFVVAAPHVKDEVIRRVPS